MTELGTVLVQGVSFDVDPKSGLIVGENSKELAKHPGAEKARQIVIRAYTKEVPFIEPMIRSKGAMHVDF